MCKPVEFIVCKVVDIPRSAATLTPIHQVVSFVYLFLYQIYRLPRQNSASEARARQKIPNGDRHAPFRTQQPINCMRG